jgi:hypothetical protein
MCREHVLTYDRCRHETSDKKLCLAAEREITKVQKRTTWCCIPTGPPKRRVVCEVEYKMYRQPGFCDHCKAVRRRERARQVRAFREEAKRKAAADQLARYRQQQEKIKDSEARAKARQAAERYEWKARAAQHDHGDSFIENPLYAQVLDLLSGPDYQEYMPPPQKSAAQKNTGSGREHSRSKPQGRAPPPLSARRLHEYSGRKPQGPPPTQAPVALPVPGVGMAIHRRQMAGVGKPQLHVMTDAGVHSGNQVVQNGGYTVPLPKQNHALMNDYGEPMPDDEFLDFVERYV